MVASKIYLYLGLCAIVLLVIFAPNRADAATPICGQQLSANAVYDGNPAFSNGIYQRGQNGDKSCAGRGTYGLRYQCVELVVRYAAHSSAGDSNFDITPWLGTNAVDFFDPAKAAAIGWTRIVNGAATTVDPPQPGDIIVFGAISHNPYGHIAVVSNVSSDGDTVTIVEQNWSDTGVATLTRKQGTGARYELNPRWKYKILGWLHKASSGQFSSLNNLSFQISPSNPALKYSGCGYFCGTGFDTTRVSDPSVVKIGGTYYMYYMGVPFGNEKEMGLATSTDGVSWTRSSQNPVLPYGQQSWSGFRTIRGKVLYDNGTFKMWYTGDDQNLYATESLGYATSPDGVQWTPYSGNPIHTSIAAPNLRVLGVAKIGGTYYMYWTATKDVNLSTSSDGIHWTDYANNPILAKATGGVSQTSAGLILVTYDGHVGQSADGIHFTLSTQPTNAPPGISTSLVEKGLLKVWYTKNDGNVIWNYGDSEIDYATAALVN